MLPFLEDLPFEIGTTLKGTDSSSGTAVTIKESILGSRICVPDEDYSLSGLTTGRPRKSGAFLQAIILRNTSGITLLPKRFVLVDKTAGRGFLKNADGYAHDTFIGPCVLVDPFLPSTGVADDDIFYGFYLGPCMCLTPSVAADFNAAIAAGSPLVAATGTTSGNSTGGRVANVTFPGQTGDTTVFNAGAYMVGWALSARTTDITNSDILVNLNVRI